MQAVTVQISGLRPFKFAYIHKSRYASAPSIANTQVSLFVRHGLPLDTPESEIQQAVAVTGPRKNQLLAVVRRKHNDLTLAPSKTELRVLTKFAPSTEKGPYPYSEGLQNYTFNSGSAVGKLKDAFGLTLQPGEGTFSTARLASFFVQPDAFGAFDAKKPIELVVLARGEEPLPSTARNGQDECTGVKLRATPVHSHQLTHILMLAFLNCSNQTSEDAVFRRNTTTEFGPAPATSEVQKWKFGELGGDSSWVLAKRKQVKPAWQNNCTVDTYESYNRQDNTCALYTAASFSVTSFDDSGGLTALVASNSDAMPVVGAQVSLFELRSNNQECRDCSKCLCNEVRQVDQLATDAHGLASFPNLYAIHGGSRYEDLQWRYLAVAQYGGEMELAPPQFVYPVTKIDRDLIVMAGDTIVDRALFDCGDTMHVTGILRAYDWQGQDVPLPTFKPSWSPTHSCHAICVTPWGKECATADAFGVVSCTMDVPTNASHGEYDVQLLTSDQSQRNSHVRTYNGRVTVTVTDPRHPSAVLHASTNALLVNPEDEDAVINLNISCETYLGDKVKNATVQVTWQGVTGEGTDRIDRKGDYTVVLTTGAQTDLPLRLPRHLARHLQIGTILSVTVTWLDATRDLLTKTLNVPVELSTWTLYVETNPPDNRIFAGFPFRATGVVRVPDAVHMDPENPPHIQLSLVKLDANGQPAAGENSSIVVAEPIAATPRLYPGSCPYDPDGDCNSRRVPALNEWTFSHSVELTIPTVEHYRLVAKVVDNTGQHLNSSLDFGRNETQQKLGVLMGWEQTFWSLYLDDADADAGYIVGDTAKVHWHNPLDDTVRVLLMWGNGGLKERQRQHLTIPHGAVEFGIPLGDECTGGCDVQAFVYFGSQKDVTLPVAQPKSQLFDLALPGAHLLPSLRIDVGLGVPTIVGIAKLAITAPVHAVAGKNATISFDVTDEQGQPAVDGEVAVYVVDEALLDLLPYELPALACAVPYRPFNNVNADVTLTSSIAFLSSEDNVAQALKSTEWRLAADPYGATKNWGVRACQGPLDIADPLWFDTAVTPITYGWSRQSDAQQLGASSWLTGGCGGTPPPGPPPSPSPAPSPGGGGGGRHPGKPGNSHPSVRRTYAATAFYQPNVIVKDGKASVTFTMPENLGTWRVSAVAVSKSAVPKHTRTTLEYVKGETTFVSRLPVSLTPSMPLIGRVGEHFTGGCVVDALAPGKVKLTISQHADSSAGSLKIESALSQVVMVRAGEPLEVLWSFEVAALGDASLQFTAVPLDKSVTGDAFVYDLPLLAVQQLVTISTSFDLLANHSFTRWTEGFDFPPAVPQSGTLSVAAGVGHFPAQRVLQQRVDKSISIGLQRPRHQWPDVFALIAALAPPAVMNTYKQQNTSANVVMNLALLALRTEYTNSNGLQQIPVRFLVYPSFAQIAPNAFALRVRREVTSEFNYSVAAQAFHSANAQQAGREWENAIVTALRSWRQNSERDEWEPTPSWWGEVTLAYWGLGKEYPLSKEYQMENASIATLKANAQVCSVEQQAMICLVLLQTNVTDSDRKLVGELSAQWYGNLRVQDGTAYVATKGSASALSLGTQALVLHVFALTKPGQPLIEELANYVAAGPTVGGNMNRWYDYSNQEATYVSFALAAIDKAVGSAVPNLAVFVAKGDGSAVFNASFSAGAAPAVRDEFTYAQLGNTARLQFYALGTGEASVALAADFIPAQLEARPIFFGLFVQKSLCLVNADGTNTPITLSDKEHPLQPGQIVQVTISVTSADDLPAGVVVYDPLPGALQAQDPLLKSGNNFAKTLAESSNSTTTNRSLGVATAAQWGNSAYNPYGWFPNSPWRWGFAQMDVFHDHVSCLTPFFGAGTSECIYTAEVVTSGTEFVLPPAHAYVPTHPGTMGLSGAAHFAVVDRQ